MSNILMSTYCLISSPLSYRQDEFNEKWLAQADSLRNAIDTSIQRILTSSAATATLDQQLCDKLKAIKVTALEREINRALGK